MHEFIYSFLGITINGRTGILPDSVKYINALGTAYLNGYLSIRDVRRNRHKVTIIDVADADYIANGMNYLAGYNQLYTISLLSDRNRKYNPYHKLSRFK